MKILIIFFLSIFLFSCSTKKYDNPHILIKTQAGDIEAELYPSKAPKTVAAFLSFIDSGFFKNSNFYRVVKTETAMGNTGMIQGGIYLSNNSKWMQLPGLPHESTKQSGLSHTDGTLSLARTTIGTGNTEFFICVGDQSQFDSGRKANEDGMGYAAFGRVTEGMNVVKKILDKPSDGKESFLEKVVIIEISKL